MRKTTSIAPLVLGIIAGVLGIIGGSCITFCGEVVDTLGGDNLISIGGYIILAGSIIGLVGGCIAKSKGIGNLLLLLAAIALVVAIVMIGFDLITCISAVLFLLAGIIGFVKHE